MRPIRLSILGLLPLLVSAGEAVWEWPNPVERAYVEEPLRVPLAVPGGKFAVEVNGAPAPYEVMAGEWGPELWVAVSVAALQPLAIAVKPGMEPAPTARVPLTETADHYEVDNGLIGIRVPKSHTGLARPPLMSVKAGGAWVGAGTWQTSLPFTGCTTTVRATGRAFVTLRLRYGFDGQVGIRGNEAAYAEIDLTVLPGRPYVIIEERHAMAAGDAWTCDLAAGWGARHGTLRIHSGGAGGQMGNLKQKTDWTLATGQTRWGDKLCDLLPRWTQHYDDSWYFAVDDGTATLGALVGRTSRWIWPHDNEIEVRVKESADAAILRCPVQRGTRWWLLTALPVGDAQAPEGLVQQAVVTPLDKVVHEFITAWSDRPGKPGRFSSEKPYGDHLNPTGNWRQLGRNAVKDMGQGAAKAGINDLTYIQSLLHPDTYGSYWDFMSPENPNFFSDFIKRPVAMAANLKAHPRFSAIAALVEQRMREDLYHSVTLPGGAGQECPGYQVHGMSAWAELAPLCQQHFGFDLAADPRFRAGAEFLVKTSQPIGNGQRRIHPGGDTHPPGPDVLEHARKFGVELDIKTLVSEELPGFGAVFRDQPGTDAETFVAFKSGPNRGHFHGDQLSIHLCSGARPLAIDHMCSYGPRAGQEHMHNRVSFRTAAMPWSNQDGYERLIAFAITSEVDIAVGEVASPRIRRVTELPPEEWDARVDALPLGGELRYRRTAVLVRGSAGPYLVLRDQYEAPPAAGVEAVYNLHVLGDRAERSGGTVVFAGMTLVVIGGETLGFETKDWGYQRKNKDGVVYWGEDTKGVRFIRAAPAGEFISVLVPGAKVPAIAATPGGIAVGGEVITFGGGFTAGADEAVVTVTRDGQTLATLRGGDISLDRSQGEIGLFVPDAGYPFGPIPDWLIRQRSGRPTWYRDWRGIVSGALGE